MTLVPNYTGHAQYNFGSIGDIENGDMLHRHYCPDLDPDWTPYTGKIESCSSEVANKDLHSCS